jgi:hypothetical protein
MPPRPRGYDMVSNVKNAGGSEGEFVGEVGVASI